jgi:DNA invertase Pin-like site-specific DNA recombinase
MPNEHKTEFEVAGNSEMATYVLYLRVSTARQGRSGLGLEAQKAAADQFIAARPGSIIIAPPFTDIESGKSNDRPELLKAIHRAKVTGSTLLIANLSRLSRDAHFLIGLQKAGVAFVAADLPEANAMTVGIMALVAQNEREAVSSRTKVALAAAKARGVKLGCPIGAAHLHGKGYDAIAREAQRSAANARAHDLIEVLADLEKEGFVSANAQARELNARGIVTARGGSWAAQSVINIKKRLA